MKNKNKKVLLLDGIHPAAEAIFSKAGFSVTTGSELGKEGLEKLLQDVVILGIRSKSKINASILKLMPKIEALGAFGVGVNQVDLTKASAKGVAVFNAPYGNTRSVVELTLAQIFGLMRQTGDKNREMHSGKWNKASAGAEEVRGKVIGIIGYGNVGSQLSVLAEFLGMRVIYYDLMERLAHGNAKKCRSMADLLKQADIVTLHIDGGKDNIKVIGEKEISMMKKGAFLINISRGMLVDVNALVPALKKGHIRGAAFDAFPEEPQKSQAKFVSPLRGLPNVLLTPHIGGSTEQAQRAIAEYVPSLLINYMETGSSLGSVNLPNIRLTPLKGSHRMLHIHHNKPGVLAGINNIFAENHCNIVGQYLKTNEDLGYVISDIDKQYRERLIKQLSGAPGTIKFRAIS